MYERFPTNYMSKDSQINNFFNNWIFSENISENITHVHTKNNFEGDFQEIPSFIHSDLKFSLGEIGINSLYSHQKRAINFIQDGKNIVLTTGPSSGKSLAYLLPILNELYKNENSNALLLFPTKALAYDQFTHITDLIDKTRIIIIGIKL
ncbi:MAG: DEAD/DEAH box helicase [Anaerolineaceae bacterium]|nr:DEAD/DEAH box helicase [Anaerolineaceae bacterium]